MRRSRRSFLESAVASFPIAGALAGRVAAEEATGYSFLLLGDLHFDRLAHHDMAWVDAHQPRDVTQIRNYSRLTAEIMPRLFASVRERIKLLRQSATPPAFVVQVGDLVEGLCGNGDLAARQNREAIAFVQSAGLDLPFLFTKGNHDISGPGADEAFRSVLIPFQQQQAKVLDQQCRSQRANVWLRHRESDVILFDAYDQDSLDWFSEVCRQRTGDRAFVVIHPPVIPYGARATWTVYSSPQSAGRRRKLLDLLGASEAIVLSGHLHKYSRLVRRVGQRRFTQLAVSSVVSAVDEAVRDRLQGIESYTPEQVGLEPRHAPETAEQRRRIYADERPFVTDFDYADSAGYAVVTVTPRHVAATIHRGTQSAVLTETSLAPG